MPLGGKGPRSTSLLQTFPPLAPLCSDALSRAMHAHGTAFAAATLTAELAAIVSIDVTPGATMKI